MELKKWLKLFVDTAPIIYFIEEHPVYINEVSRKLHYTRGWSC